MILDLSLEYLLKVAKNPIYNYAICGLSSWVIEERRDGGMIRLFKSSRNHQDAISPHSHRFDFECKVLRGEVINRIWRRDESAEGDSFQETRLVYMGTPGVYNRVPGQIGSWSFTDSRYGVGDRYAMTSDEVHSIQFSKGAIVLLVEGAPIERESIVLEPFERGQIVPMAETQPWMFQRGSLQ